jgi:hypothetical protein
VPFGNGLRPVRLRQDKGFSKRGEKHGTLVQIG